MSKINKIKVENTTYDIQDNTSGFITKDVNDLTNYELKIATGNSIEMSIDSSTYVMTLSLKNSQGTILNTQTVDLPLETMVVGGTYDSTNKKIVLTLKNGNTIDVPVGDLINGLQSEITSTNKLDASLVDDSLSNNKFVTSTEKTTWNNKADTSDIPTKTSDLVNDSDYQTLTEVQNLIKNVDNVFELNRDDYTTVNPLNFSTLKKGVYIHEGNSSESDFYYKKDENSQSRKINSIHPLLLVVFDTVDNIGTPTQDTNIALMYEIEGNASYLYEYTFYITNNGALMATKSPVMANFIGSGNQLLNGVKTFSSIPKQYNTTAPTQDTEFTNKKYVDDSISSAITTTLNGSY